MAQLSDDDSSGNGVQSGPDGCPSSQAEDPPEVDHPPLQERLG